MRIYVVYKWPPDKMDIESYVTRALAESDIIKKRNNKKEPKYVLMIIEGVLLQYEEVEVVKKVRIL